MRIVTFFSFIIILSSCNSAVEIDFDDSVSKNESDSQPNNNLNNNLPTGAPVLENNLELNLVTGSIASISDSNLKISDSNSSPDQVSFTLTSEPSNGYLIDNLGNIFSTGDSFTQEQINNGDIKYVQTDNSILNDSFNFYIQDEESTQPSNASVANPAIFSINITAGVCSNSTATNYNDITSGNGSGDSFDDAFLICTTTQLIDLSLNCESAGGNYAACSKFFKLASSLDMSGISMNSIAEGSAVFDGGFDGQNLAIINLTKPGEASATDRRGLFDYINNATLKNLQLVNIDNSFSDGFNLHGGLTAVALNSTIDNIKISGIMNSPSANRTGGIVGQISNTSITNSIISLDITGAYNVGGVVAEINTVVANSFIDGIYGIGNITGSTGGIGGAIGSWEDNGLSTLSNSTFEFNINSSGKAGGAVGRIFNGGTKTISGININNITLECLGAECGGLMGSAGSITNLSNITIDSINIDTQSTGSANRIGGIVGVLGGNDFSITGSKVLDSTINATNSNEVGGLIGYISISGDLNASLNYVENTNISCIHYCGGFIGDAQNGTNSASNNYVLGGLVNASGTGPSAGFIGRNQSPFSFQNNYASINVMAPSGNIYTGGFVGYNGPYDGATYTDNYFNTEVYTYDGLNNAIGSSGNAQDLGNMFDPLTVSEMSVSTNFLNWDFVSTWVIGPDGYPIHQ